MAWGTGIASYGECIKVVSSVRRGRVGANSIALYLPILKLASAERLARVPNVARCFGHPRDQQAAVESVRSWVKLGSAAPNWFSKLLHEAIVKVRESGLAPLANYSGCRQPAAGAFGTSQLKVLVPHAISSMKKDAVIDDGRQWPFDDKKLGGRTYLAPISHDGVSFGIHVENSESDVVEREVADTNDDKVPGNVCPHIEVIQHPVAVGITAGLESDELLMLAARLSQRAFNFLQNLSTVEVDLQELLSNA